MKILLIKPPLIVPRNFSGMSSFFPPLGLGYIAASLEKNDYDVKILDAGIEKWRKINKMDDGNQYVGMSFKEITRLIKKEKPDVVGINFLTVQAKSAFFTAKAVKDANEDIIVVAGGPHISVKPDQTISDQNIDFIVIGEGEITMLELVKALETN